MLISSEHRHPIGLKSNNNPFIPSAVTNSAISILHGKETFPEVRGSSKLDVLIPRFSIMLAEKLYAL